MPHCWKSYATAQVIHTAYVHTIMHETIMPLYSIYPKIFLTDKPRQTVQTEIKLIWIYTVYHSSISLYTYHQIEE